MSIVRIRFLLQTRLLIFAVDNAKLVLLTARNSEANLFYGFDIFLNLTAYLETLLPAHL